MSPEEDDKSGAAQFGPKGQPVSIGRPVPFFDAIFRSRRVRDEIFDVEGLFTEPAWDILLALAAAELQGCRIAFSDIGQDARVPNSVATRYIAFLQEIDLVECHGPRDDEPATFVGLTAKGREKLHIYAERVGAIYDYTNWDPLLPKA